ncbi:alpha/beta hydrolase family protein [Lentzea aerocolonigenes]|uniref:alpha/beta hydrolase family protein n=1 Tax=Lentzea aerocolonigenes TaxID=68170 RepID=UPI000696D3E4|nr:alpha/beta hydrolase [Lentzea aerocolonigenes]
MVVLFAVGGGGDPERHRPLLDALADQGLQVIAPRFDRLLPQAATEELLVRPRGLLEALDGTEGSEVVVIGHSIGAWAALCLAGAVPWGRDRRPIEVPRSDRISRLVLLAPAAGWFGAPGALDAVDVPMLVFAGTADTVTPMAQAELLRSAAGPVDLRVVPGAGHFSFLHTLPPGVAEDPAFDRAKFLAEMVEEIVRFVRR